MMQVRVLLFFLNRILSGIYSKYCENFYNSFTKINFAAYKGKYNKCSCLGELFSTYIIQIHIY